MNTITLTSKTGRDVTLTNNGRDITATIPAMSLNLGGVDLTDAGVISRFLVNVGGISRRVEVQFGAMEMATVSKLFADMMAGVKANADFEAEMERRQHQVLRGMNS